MPQWAKFKDTEILFLKKSSIGITVCICALVVIVALVPALIPHSDGVRYDENTTCFDTVSRIYCYADCSDDEFEESCRAVWDVLLRYHRLLDIYNEYSGMNNLCTLNENAGGDAVVLDRELIDFLLYAKEVYALTGGKTNVMIGALTSLWHDAREGGGYVPDAAELEAAAEHIGIELLEIDEVACTARITDSRARIDVGALGKGYATEAAAQLLEGRGVTSYVLNIGGNIRTVGQKPDGSDWSIGITDPRDVSKTAATVLISELSCVTSGDYQRYFTLNGTRYHHIIDTETLMPAEYFSSVTVICKDSALADALSTALFCMSHKDGLALVSSLDEKVEVVWIDHDGVIYSTDGAPLK